MRTFACEMWDVELKKWPSGFFGGERRLESRIRFSSFFSSSLFVESRFLCFFCFRFFLICLTLGELSQSQSSHILSFPLEEKGASFVLAKYQGAIVRFTSLDVNWRTTQYSTGWWISDVHSRMMSFFVNYYYSRRPGSLEYRNNTVMR